MNDNRDYEFQVSCAQCKRTFTLRVRFEDYMLFDSPYRPHIQDIFPYLTPVERELLISHTCEECWNKMFSFNDEEVSEDE